MCINKLAHSYTTCLRRLFYTDTSNDPISTLGLIYLCVLKWLTLYPLTLGIVFGGLAHTSMFMRVRTHPLSIILKSLSIKMLCFWCSPAHYLVCNEIPNH